MKPKATFASYERVRAGVELASSLEDPNAYTDDLKWAHRLTAEVLVVMETLDLLSRRAEAALAKVRNRVGPKARVALKRQRRRWPPDDKGALHVSPAPPPWGVPVWKGSDEACSALWIRVGAVAAGAAGLLFFGTC